MTPRPLSIVDAVVADASRVASADPTKLPETALLLTLVAHRRAVDVSFEQLFQQAIDAVRPAEQSLTLVGPNGLGAMLMIQNALTRYGADIDVCETTDAAMAEFAVSTPSPQFDAFNGVAGRLTYLVERPTNALNQTSMRRLLDQLADLAKRDADGVYWSLDSAPLLGMAHGTAGVISALASVIASGRGAPNDVQLLTACTRWLLAQRSAGLAPYQFPFEAGGREVRLAWCHCDLGIAVALAKAAKALGRDDWRAEARAVAVNLTSISVADSGVVDAALCHGAAGVSLLFETLGELLGDERLSAAARRWVETACELWPIATEESFMTGTLGAALAMERVTTGTKADWPRFLMLL